MGWVLLHDRLLDGSSAVVDTVLVGPPGIVVLAAKPGRHVHRGSDGSWWSGGQPLEPARARLSWTVGQVIARVSAQRPDWSLIGWAALIAPDTVLGPPRLEESPQVLTVGQLRDWVTQLQPALSAVQVADLAAGVEAACPPAPLL